MNPWQITFVCLEISIFRVVLSYADKAKIFIIKFNNYSEMIDFWLRDEAGMNWIWDYLPFSISMEWSTRVIRVWGMHTLIIAQENSITRCTRDEELTRTIDSCFKNYIHIYILPNLWFEKIYFHNGLFKMHGTIYWEKFLIIKRWDIFWHYMNSLETVKLENRFLIAP